MRYLEQPLTTLLRKNESLSWSPNCQQAFEYIKCILVSQPVLTDHNFRKPFKLMVDASDVGCGVVILQEDDSEIDPFVSYCSHKFNTHQKLLDLWEGDISSDTCSVTLLCIFGCPCCRSTGDSGVDHNPLVFINCMRDKTQKLLRWTIFKLLFKHVD